MPLLSNKGRSFQGSIVLGKGFVLSPEEAEKLIKKDPRNNDVLFPYLNGDDLNNDPEQKPSRWVINFFDWPEEKAKTYPDCYEIVERLVKPERQRWKKDNEGNEIIGTYALRKPLPQKWWIYGEKRPSLYNAISELDQVMVIALTSKTVAVTLVPSDMVFSHSLGIFLLNDFISFALMQSTIHNIWSWQYGSSMKSDLRYTPSACFETFPAPTFLDFQAELLESIGKKYHETRVKLMKQTKLGLTKVYNLFHESRFRKIDKQESDLLNNAFLKEFGASAQLLRKHLANNEVAKYNYVADQIDTLKKLHIEMDKAVLYAYGWNDIELKHDYYELDYLPETDKTRFTIHPTARKEILKRLVVLNLQNRHEEQNIDNRSTKKTQNTHISTDSKNSNQTLFPEN